MRVQLIQSNASFNGILDSKKPISGKYLDYTPPYTLSTQHLFKIYNGAEVQGVSYNQYLGGLYITYSLADKFQEGSATYISSGEAWELGDKANKMKSFAKDVLEDSQIQILNAKYFQKQLLDEYNSADIASASNIGNSFKTIDVEVDKTIISIPTNEENELFDVYEFDSFGTLTKSMKNVKYMEDGSYAAQEVHVFDVEKYECLLDVKAQGDTLYAKHAYTFDVLTQDKFSYAKNQTKVAEKTMAESSFEYENGALKAYNEDFASFENGSFSCKKRYAFYSSGDFYCAYDYCNNNSRATAQKMFYIENNILSRVESLCRQNCDGELQGEHIIVTSRKSKYRPKAFA